MFEKIQKKKQTQFVLWSQQKKKKQENEENSKLKTAKTHFKEIYLIEGDDIRSESGTLAFITVDGSRNIRDDNAGRKYKVSTSSEVDIDQLRPRWTRLARRQSQVVTEIVAEADNWNRFLGGWLRIEPVDVERHFSTTDKHQNFVELDGIPLGFWWKGEKV